MPSAPHPVHPESSRGTRWGFALLVVAVGGCTAGSTGTPECTAGVDHSLKSTGTCGAAVTVTVKTGSTCLPSAFTGFNSELAGFPTATNNDHLVSTVLVVADAGTETRTCGLKAAADAGFTVSCDLCKGATDAGCAKFGTCEASLVP